MIREAKLRDARFIFDLGEQVFSWYDGQEGKSCLIGLERPDAVALISADESTGISTSPTVS
jgi:hypothetical protein